MKTKITKEMLDVAQSKGISQATVYRRVRQKGWSIEDAISTPTNPQSINQRKASKLFGLERGRTRGVRLPKDWEEKIDNHIAESGLTESDLIAEIVGKAFGFL